MIGRTASLWLLLGIILIGVVLREYELTARSLWFDEAFSWRLISFSPLELIARDAKDVHPPLYYLVLQAWSVVFGTSLLALRNFSVALAGCTIAAGYLFAAEGWRSRRTGLVAALFLAVSGFQIQFAWEARMYTLGTFFVLLSSWFLLRGLRSTGSPAQQAWTWLGYSLIASAMIYTHYYGLFTLVSQLVFFLGYIIWTTRGRLGEIADSRQFWLGLVALFMIIVLYVPWLPTFLVQNQQVQDSYWIPKIGGWSIPDTFYRMLAPTSGIPTHEGFGWIMFAIVPMVGIFITWIVLAWSNREASTRDASLLAVCGASVPFILSIVVSFTGSSLYQDRFFVFAQLFIIIIIAVLVARITSPLLRTVAIVAVALGLLGSFAAYWIEIDILANPGAQAATSLVYELREDTEPVLVSSPFIYFSILHYAEESFAGVTLPKLYSPTGELAHFAGGPILTGEDVVGDEIFSTDSKALWVVDTTGFGGTPLQVPAPWRPNNPQAFSEVFSHQGSVFVTKYVR